MQNVTFCGMPSKVYKVAPKVFAGPELKYKDLKKLKKEGVSLIFDLRPLNFKSLKSSFVSPFKLIKEKIMCLYLGIKHKKYSIDLTEKMPGKKFFEKLVKKIDKNKKKIYIHDASGKHEAGFASAAIEIMKEKTPPKQAIQKMLSRNFWSISGSETKAVKKAKIENLQKKLKEFMKLFGVNY